MRAYVRRRGGVARRRPVSRSVGCQMTGAPFLRTINSCLRVRRRLRRRLPTAVSLSAVGQSSLKGRKKSAAGHSTD